MSQLRALISFALLAVPGALGAQDTTYAAPKIRHSPDVISAQEIEAAPEAARTAFDLVRQLRPMWLAARGPGSMTLTTPAAQIYVDGVRRNGSNALNDIPRGSIREMRHLRGTEATQRFGLDHENGAILVITR